MQSWDTTNKASEFSAFSVCTSWGVLGKNLYLIDVLRRRMEYPELKRVVREQYERFDPGVVLIEDKASGIQLIQELIAEVSTPSRATARRATRSCACTRRPR